MLKIHTCCKFKEYISSHVRYTFIHLRWKVPFDLFLGGFVLWMGIPTSLVTFTQQSELPDTGMQQRNAVRRVLFTHWMIVYFADFLLIGSDEVGQK